jgi:serine/threonine-protein kinase
MSDETLHATIDDSQGIRGRLAASLEGRYRVESPLGAGGMSTVWLAEDLKHKRHVAIKVLTPEVANSIGTERFLKEIEIAAGLRHPRILPLYDSGEASGLLYYVMPRIEGESLRQRIERRPALSLDESVRLIGEVAEALSYAHSRDVVHRDIKPENILLEEGHALVTDFGIARAVMSAGDARLTSTGVRVGTPLYMSPEQSASDGNVDARTDVYSLACVLFEMLAGRPPFTGSSADAVLIQRFTQPPPRIATLRGDVPNAVDNAIYRAMARDPAERFESVKQFADALRPAAGSAADVAGASSIAVLPFTNMSGNPAEDYFADGISEEIINALARIEGLRVAARTSTFAFKGRQEDLRQVGEKLNVATVLEGSVRRAGNRLRITAQLIKVADGYHLWSERYDRELTDIFEIQDEIAGAIVAKLRGAMAPALPERRGTANLEAHDLYLKALAIHWRRGRYVLDSCALLEQAIAIDPNFADAQSLLADGYRLMALYGVERPAVAMPKARAAAERALELDPNQAEALTTLADVAHAHDLDYELGMRLWARALEVQPDHLRTLCDNGVWGVALLEGRPEAALKQIRRAIELDPLSAWPAGMNVLALLIAGKREEALAEGRRAVEMDPGSFLAHYQLLGAQIALGDAAAALETARRAVQTWRHPWYLARLGVASAMAGDKESAQAVFDELMARSKTDYVQQFWFAVLAASLGRMDEAIDSMLRCVADRDPIAIWVIEMPECESMRRHARFPEVLHALKLDEFWKKHPPAPPGS